MSSRGIWLRPQARPEKLPDQGSEVNFHQWTGALHKPRHAECQGKALPEPLAKPRASLQLSNGRLHRSRRRPFPLPNCLSSLAASRKNIFVPHEFALEKMVGLADSNRDG